MPSSHPRRNQSRAELRCRRPAAGRSRDCLAGGWSARIALGGGVDTAVPALARLVTGVVAKWLLLVVVLALGILVLALPPLPMLVAAVVVLLAQVVALALGG